MAAPVKQLSYPEAVERILRLGHEGRALKWDLESIRALLERLGHPEKTFATVHIAGTNGKGSVAALVASILAQAGYRAGLYTSPHLCRINERLAINGAPIGDDGFAATFARIESAIEELLAEDVLPHNPSYFETLTAMALHHFAGRGVEVAVLEVGLGGRLDATNIVTPVVTAVTAVDFDHERWLGHSIESIAAEKAGILKPGVPVVNAAENPVARDIVSRRAQEIGAPLVDAAGYRAEDIQWRNFGQPEFTACAEGFSLRLSLGLRGRHQIANALTAVAIVRELARQGFNISSQAIQEGIRRARWAGRLQLLRPKGEGGPALLLDGAHNPAAARRLRQFWDEHLAPPASGLKGQRVHLIYGSLRDKAVEEIAGQLFPPAASVTLTQPDSPRALSVSTLGLIAQDFNARVEFIPEPQLALRHALRQALANDVVLVAGSLYLVGNCLRALEEEKIQTLP